MDAVHLALHLAVLVVYLIVYLAAQRIGDQASAIYFVRNRPPQLCRRRELRNVRK